MTTYERRSLYRFLSLYLGSVFLLLGIVGYLFYKKQSSMMLNEMRLEMIYQVRMIESKLIMAEEKGDLNVSTKALLRLKPGKFKIGFFDKNGKALFTEIPEKLSFDKEFYTGNSHCYCVLKYPSTLTDIGYIALREDVLKKNLLKLKWRIFYYLVALLAMMSFVGYFLSKLFLKPIREKIETLDRFIEDTTHELNTPVSAILMTIQNLKLEDDKKLNRLKASAMALSTVYGSLTYALEMHKDIVSIEEFDLRRFIIERINIMRVVAESRYIAIEHDLHKCTVKISKEEMGRVLDNLLSNAVKYSNKDTTIRISLHDERIKICDEGIGIPKSELKNILKRFHRHNKERGGFGLGLGIVKSICDKYGIKLEIDSMPGKGSCFELFIKPIVVSCQKPER